jgi:chemotaxis protein CheY-P-specific phosphatase CheC
MKYVLTPLELDLIRELFSMGLASAADSLSMMTGCKIITQSLRIHGYQENSHVNFGLKSKRKVNIFTSYLKGDLAGVSFWTLGLRDSIRLSKLMLGSAGKNRSREAVMELREAVLLEMDNVITAAVVTRMANLLDKRLYGNVPGVEGVDRRKLQAFIQEKVEPIDPAVQILSKIRVVDHAINMEFHWYLPAEFIESLRKLHARSGAKALLGKVS